MEQYEIRNRAILPEVLEAFMASEQTAVCPRCGADDVDYVESDGGLEDGWQQNTLRCYECGTEWIEEFECVPQPIAIKVVEYREERIIDSPTSSHRGRFTDEELEAIVEGVIAER